MKTCYLGFPDCHCGGHLLMHQAHAEWKATQYPFAFIAGATPRCFWCGASGDNECAPLCPTRKEETTNEAEETQVQKLRARRVPGDR